VYDPDTDSDVIAVWEGRGRPTPVGAASDVPHRDLPAGWIESTYFYQRVYLDGSGLVELRRGDGGVVWSSAETGVGQFGAEVGAAVVGPGGLIAYTVGGELWLADRTDPGNPYASLGYAVDFDWAPDGGALVVNDGAALTLFDAGGTPSGSVGNAAGVPIAGARWTGQGVVYVTLGPEPAVRVLPAEAFLPTG
jgi:hypothetical protein